MKHVILDYLPVVIPAAQTQLKSAKKVELADVPRKAAMWRSKFLLQREADGITFDALFAIIMAQQRIGSLKNHC